MINWDKLSKKIKSKKVLDKINIKIVLSAIILILCICYGIIIHKYIQKRNYANEVIEIAKRNEETVFSVEKVYVCSSANAVDTGNEQKSNEFNIYQYTDMAIYLNNYKEENGLTNKNTVKQLYIDNIELNVDKNIGTQSLKYTNLLEIGSRKTVTDFSKQDRIDFNVIYTNDENQLANYDNPTFYTDCSNPISLKYINNLEKNYSVEQGSSVNFDGSILKKAGISIEDINCNIKFKINLINNNDEYFSCWINLAMPLDEIYNGTSIKSTTPTGSKYDFFLQ